MPIPLTVPLPPGISLWDSCIIRVAAIDPTDGSIVSGVTVSDVTIECEELSGPPLGAGDVGPFMLIPGPGA